MTYLQRIGAQNSVPGTGRHRLWYNNPPRWLGGLPGGGWTELCSGAAVRGKGEEEEKIMVSDVFWGGDSSFRCVHHKVSKTHNQSIIFTPRNWKSSEIVCSSFACTEFCMLQRILGLLKNGKLWFCFSVFTPLCVMFTIIKIRFRSTIISHVEKCLALLTLWWRRVPPTH